ncbi:MAG: ABC transporter ATP-binding protein, partial [Anaerolineae bacterium]|nr:ABC transporter ATP-binding protein [Anaerolineae bacterium]
MSSAETIHPNGSDPAALPVWKVVLAMVRFRPWYWFVDFLAVGIIRIVWQLAPGLVLREFFNLLTGEAQARFGIYAILAFSIAMFLARVLGEFGFYYADVPIFADVTTLLRKNLLRHILRRPGASPLPDSAGEAVSRFRNDVREIPLFVLWFNDILVGLMVIAAAVILMSQVSVWVTLLALAPVLAVGLIANSATARIEAYRKASREATGKVTGFIGEFFGAVQAIKVATAEQDVIAHFDRLNEERRKLTLRERLFDTVLDTIWRNTSSLGTGVILILAGQSMRAGTFTLGDFSLFVYLISSLGDLTTFTGMIAARYKQLSVSVKRMYRLMEGAPLNALVEPGEVDLNGPLPEVHYASLDERDRLESLEVRGLTYHFAGSDRGIDDVSFKLQRGTLTVITGRIGSGKTTLLRTLLGLLPADAGEVRWNGRLVEHAADFFVPPRVAYTGQVPRLFSADLRSNILLGLQRSDDEIRKAAYLAVL